MPDSRRLGSLPHHETADRDGRAEALLVAGLDQYFNRRYEEAIHLWTRVLFLDRSHARARAYIDRARTALAERQRRADEILHETDASLARGDAAGARELLTQAEAALADEARAAGLRSRLERLETAGHADAADRRARPGGEPRARGTTIGRGRWLILPVALLVGAGLAVALSERTRAWLGLAGPPASTALAGAATPAVVMSTDEVVMTRATTLMSRGRLAEALKTLERIAPDSAHASSADALRLRIQQLLLSNTPRAEAARAERQTNTP